MASIPVIKKCLELLGEARVTAFIWGDKGIGKSSLVQQLCEEKNIGFIDFRASQIEASDLRGLPDKVDGRTVYLPPIDLPTGDLADNELDDITFDGDLNGRREKGILLLDEVNRSQDDVLQSLFQLVLDRRLGKYVLPDGWQVVCAGNFMEGYQVSGFSDAAFLDRFCHLTLSSDYSTFGDWVNYMHNKYGEKAQPIIEFTANDIKTLDGNLGDRDLGFTIEPSRRSWEMVQRILIAFDDKRDYYGEAVLTEVMAGLVGRDVALSYSRYDCPVKPKQLLDRGVAANRAALDGLTRQQGVGLMWGLSNAAKRMIDTKEVANTCLDYAEYLLSSNKDHDLVVAFLRSCINNSAAYSKEDKNVALATLTNVTLAKYFRESMKDKQAFLVFLFDRPELHKLVSVTAWGK